MPIIGFIGRTGCGKTFLAQHDTAEYWRQFRYRSVVLDINPDQHKGWGVWSWVTADREAWLAKVRHPATRNVMVFCDDATMTVNRAPELLDLFTRLSRRGRRLHVCGHGNSNFTPLMRAQITELFLFRVSRDEAAEWASLFADDTIKRATQLNFDAHEFVWATLGKPSRVCRLDTGATP